MLDMDLQNFSLNDYAALEGKRWRVEFKRVLIDSFGHLKFELLLKEDSGLHDFSTPPIFVNL